MPKKTPRQTKREKKQHKQADELNDVVSDTASVFTSALETASDFHWQCERGLDDLDTDILFNRLAHSIWQEHTEKGDILAQALGDFLAERERHQGALITLKERFGALTLEKSPARLEPFELYANIIREALRPKELEK
jgi:hypothetical protein